MNASRIPRFEPDPANPGPARGAPGWLRCPSPLGRVAHQVVLVMLLMASPVPATALQETAPDSTVSAFPIGAAVDTVDFGGTSLNLHFYKPGTYDGEGFILLFHGASRTASGYRDSAMSMAERFGRFVVVPEFDQERFPNRTYQFGGVFREDRTLADPEEWTYAFVPMIIDHIRAREGNGELPYLMLGFSAGGQFVSRMAALQDSDAERLLVISPGSVIFPTREMNFGLGFGGLPDELSNDKRIRRFLGLPITVYIGTNDTEMAQLPTGDAYAQGVHRYSRNIRWFNEAMDLAYTNEWPFNWRLVIADGPGHSPPDMFDHPQMENALFGHRGTGGVVQKGPRENRGSLFRF